MLYRASIGPTCTLSGRSTALRAALLRRVCTTRLVSLTLIAHVALSAVRNLASTLLSLPPASATSTKPASEPAISYIPAHRLSTLSGAEAHDVVFVIVAGAEKL